MEGNDLREPLHKTADAEYQKLTASFTHLLSDLKIVPGGGSYEACQISAFQMKIHHLSIVKSAETLLQMASDLELCHSLLSPPRRLAGVHSFSNYLNAQIAAASSESSKIQTEVLGIHKPQIFFPTTEEDDDDVVFEGVSNNEKISNSLSQSVMNEPRRNSIDVVPQYERVQMLWEPWDYENALQAYLNFLDTNTTTSAVNRAITTSLNIILQTIKIFGPQYTIIAFNGGKDAVVLLHLYRAALAQYYHTIQHTEKQSPILAFFQSDDEFSEIVNFILKTSNEYSVDLKVYNGSYEKSVAKCLGALRKDDISRPVAFIIGLRQGDPETLSCTTFEPSSPWLGNDINFMRVHPMLEWTYGDTWEFIRKFHLTYCCLYDVGYTSIGTRRDSHPNDMLRLPNGTYKPAYELNCWDGERFGRHPRKDSSSSDKNARSPFHLPLQPCKTKSIRTAGILTVDRDLFTEGIQDELIVIARQYFGEGGAILRRISYTQNDPLDIYEELMLQMRRCDIVIVTNSFGSEYDDVTLRAIAKALGRKIVKNDTMQKHLNVLFNTNNLTEHQLRLCLLPEGCDLHPCPDESWPILQCAKIFIIPGITKLFTSKIKTLCSILFPQSISKQHPMAINMTEDSKILFPSDMINYHDNVPIGT